MYKRQPHELTIPNETLQSYLFSSTEAAPEHTAIHFLGKNITYEPVSYTHLRAHETNDLIADGVVCVIWGGGGG
ncbi:hypothetical protein, partial [Bacillus pumilus]|uniref:hypothetical protein n=1 Tax=Bacillus pumilus TaxID=1408 RepID=UPI0028F741F8